MCRFRSLKKEPPSWDCLCRATGAAAVSEQGGSGQGEPSAPAAALTPGKGEGKEGRLGGKGLRLQCILGKSGAGPRESWSCSCCERIPAPHSKGPARAPPNALSLEGAAWGVCDLSTNAVWIQLAPQSALLPPRTRSAHVLGLDGPPQHRGGLLPASRAPLPQGCNPCCPRATTGTPLSYPHPL